MKTLALAMAAVLAMILVPSLAHAQSAVQYACPTQTCPGGQVPVPVQPQPQYVQPQVTQPPPVVVQPTPVPQATNTTQSIDPALLKIILGLQSQLNNLQNQIISLKATPAPQVMTNSTPPPPPPPPDNGGGGGSCPSSQNQQSGSSCSGGGGGPGPMFYQGPGFQGFYGSHFGGGGHFGGHHGGR